MNNDRATWFVFGLILVTVLSMYAPRIAGMLVILVVTVLAIETAGGMGHKKII